MSAEGLRIYARMTYGVEFTAEEAEKHRAAFFRAYPSLAKWHQDTRNRKAQETRTPWGRRRLLHAFTPDTERLSSPVQGAEADGAKAAMALLWERRAQCPEARPIIFNHDEIVLEVPEGMGEQAKTYLEGCMIDGMMPVLNPVPVKVEGKVCRSWGAA